MIRRATPTDADFAAPLIYEAIGDIAHSLTGATEPNEVIRVMSQFFAQTGNRLSYENAVIAMDKDKPVGLALFYHGSQTQRLDRPFEEHVKRVTGETPHIVKEARDDEFYLDTVVVSGDSRGKGIGKALLNAFEEESERRGHEKIALLVDEDNQRARKLYESIGYRQDGTIMVSGHLYSHMVKSVMVPV
ncbi:GNAT family N-acetyltransferase [Brevibacillus choshinensis]|uniref:GNAT family N-acetyltransferase n=1 Tax=Brevibacillus choshinensis TaxID=54911 RepID=A0ABX7FVB4_BRECH|nr:GNAT family N-acetyltransferase [Brevibacillus choshinensis]QRG69474.1 GNAT family N-acetyltransferase [Brevibacillus choshinensis]